MSSILLAIPSKGRLEEATREVFADLGMPIERPGGARSYLGEMAAMPDVTVRFLSASEIARELIAGNIDLGVTGEDLVHEAAERGIEQVELAKPLGFGGADVVVGLPESWVDVTAMRDLADVASDYRHRHGQWLRVATKYINLTRKHFALHGIAEYRIVQSMGATEAAPASGAAELIVDITSSGSTLKANQLKVPKDGVILKSEANLVVARNAQWDKEKLNLMRDFLDKMEKGLGEKITETL
ncbi:ATP phosphoribosyltransferase [Maritalea mediterranea]|uniref:ATP phosphoribosyltransferase n=1 Tax=Maritalea mediterranea TaxID=2909667 RepID=A0ABS9E7K7_9HYPH|nr:ATP phosphoribosyltransferase [Maritalea mediterranea]MCF4097755.1 ATP phosphoribosyltransferase [Maritalea mediterranea]